MMIALLKKDWRTFRAAVLASVILGVAPYLIGYILTFTPNRDKEPWSDRWLDTYPVCAAIGLVITAVMAIAFAGTGIATERHDRTLDFLNMLPPRRWQVLLSKLAVSLPFLVLCTIIHSLIFIIGLYAGALRHSMPQNFTEELGHFLFICLMWGSGTFMAFCVAWMLSTCLSSSVLCTGIAIAVLVAAAAMLGVLANANRWSDDFAATVWCAVSLPIGITAFVAGSILYMRRVQP